MTEIAARLARPIQRLGPLSTLGLCLALVIALGGTAVLARALTLREAILPGTIVAGVEVGGLARSDAEAKIAAALGERLARPVEVSVAGKVFSVVPASVFELDAAATERTAYAEARESVASRLGALALPFAFTTEVDPVLDLRTTGRAALSRELVALTKRPVRARVAMEGRAPVIVPARLGTAVDEATLLAALRRAALGGVSGIVAPVERIEPALTTADAERAATVARTAVAAPVEVRLRRKQLGELGERKLAKLVRFQPAGGAYEVTLDVKGLERLLAPLVEPHLRKPVDASFRVVGERVRVVPDKAGTTLDAEQARTAVLAAATEPGLRRARVALTELAPSFTTRQARALGIRERVSTFTTDMGVSSPNRIWNVQLLGRYLDGTILKPGQTFSYNKIMGPRTAERGFREGQMIFGGVLIPSIGGGVCQTATTIFNAAFEAGLPIKERRNHSFYISHYPVGRDATVAWGGPDFVFTNDLDHAILIKAHGTTATFTVTFYGTKQGRKVVSSTSTPTNYTEPRLQYAIDPTAARGSVRRTSGGGPGFDVNVQRKVYERGKLIRADEFFTRYTPENPTAIYGPGSTPPGPYFYLPSSS